MRDWKIQNKINNDPNKIIETILRNRGLKTQKDIKEFQNPTDPLRIKLAKVGLNTTQVEKSIKRIKKAIKDQQSIFIYGDYDADGICASAILWEALHNSGANVLPFMPKRDEHGYGLNQSGIEKILQDESVIDQKPLIITVDNGIVAHQGVKFANKNGLEVIITDHHQPKKTLPAAFSIIHSTAISGAGVAWFLAREILEKNNKLAADLLDLAAVGTISDMMELTGANRSLVKFGLPRLSRTDRVGWQAMFKKIGIKDTNLETYHVSFMIAPRLNAVGRLGHALDSLRLLCTRNPDRATRLANKLDQINQERQDLTERILNHAKSESFKAQKLIFVADQSYHPGVVGLVAGRLVDYYYRPAVVVSMAEEVCRGSVRSIKGFDIIKALRQFEDLFEDLGGHPMAAGFSIRTENLPKLEQKMTALADQLLTKDLLKSSLDIDCQIQLKDISKKLYQAVSQLAPFGVGNPKPIFATPGLEVTEVRAVGIDNHHLKLRIAQDNREFDVIGFRFGFLTDKIEPGQKIDLAYTVDENTFNGHTSLQLKIKDLQPSQE